MTPDDLSAETAEAIMETSQWIQQLPELYARRQPPLTDPGPPIELPHHSSGHQAATANPFRQASAVFLRAVALHCPLGMVRFSRVLLLCAALSVCLGAIFWDLRATTAPQHGLADWLAFHVVVMS
ncbi:hypothetical protein B566_EDAN013625 [Ephemera danica]|nr:hypothetical protein B566_EDAN013625 [Ephemera danica]